VHKYYNDLANYFLLTDDIWLSDYFFGKCLSATSENLGSDDAMRTATSASHSRDRVSTAFCCSSPRAKGNCLLSFFNFVIQLCSQGPDKEYSG